MSLAKIFSEAGATLGRIIQQAEEVFLDVPRTNYTEEYKNNIKKVDFLILMTEKLIFDAQIFLDPNSESSEKRMPTEEFGISLQNPLIGTKEFSLPLYKDMYRSGKYERKLGFLLNNYQTKALDTYIMKLKKLLDVNFKNLKEEEVSLENTRLDHDYIKNRVENAFTTAGREALEKELEKIKPVFEKHYARTMENFKNVDSYFVLHRQFLKEFIEIQRDYYRECDKNLTNLIKKLHGDTYRITYELGVDQYFDGFVSSSDVDEMINKGKMLAMAKLNQSIERQNNELGNASTQITIEAETDNADSDDEDRKFGIKLTTERCGLEPIYDQDEKVFNGHTNGYDYEHGVENHLGTNGILTLHPIRVVVENENKNSEETLDLSLGLEDNNEKYRTCAKPFQEHFGGFGKEKLDTSDLSYSIKIEENDLNEFNFQGEAIESISFQSESHGIPLEDIMEPDAEQTSLDVNLESEISGTVTCIGEISIEQPDLHISGHDINLGIENNTNETWDSNINLGGVLTVEPPSLDCDTEIAIGSNEHYLDVEDGISGTITCIGEISIEQPELHISGHDINLGIENNTNETWDSNINLGGVLTVEPPSLDCDTEIAIGSNEHHSTKSRDIDLVFGTDFDEEQDLAEDFDEDKTEDREPFVSCEANLNLGSTIEPTEHHLVLPNVEIVDAGATFETESAEIQVELDFSEDASRSIQLKTEDSEKKDSFSAKGGFKSSFGFSGGARTKSRSPILQSGEKEDN